MNLLVANDNGNSEHKITIDGVLYKQPNVYAMHHTEIPESDESLENAIENLHENIIVQIDSKSVPHTGSNRYVVGHRALGASVVSDLYNMGVDNVEKHNEKLPIINTLAILAAVATQKQFNEHGNIEDGQNIKVSIDMTTALPASNHNSETEKIFRDKFVGNMHEVKVYINKISVNVQIIFEHVKVLKEGVPALFAIIEDGKGNYRDDGIFDSFKKDYNHKDIDGSYFRTKRLLHVDIGDGTTELTFTEGYKADSMKSDGKKFGLGQALEKGSENLSRSLNGLAVTRQSISMYLKRKEKFYRQAMDAIQSPKMEVADRLKESINTHIKDKLSYEVDVIVVYGGASILLEDVLYEELKNEYKDFGIEVLWIPEQFAVEMNVIGMDIYNQIQFAENKE